MPLYEYTCTSCHAEFELLVRGSDVPACPKCHSEALERRVSVFRAGASGSNANASTGAVDSTGSVGDLSPGARGPNYEVSKSI